MIMISYSYYSLFSSFFLVGHDEAKVFNKDQQIGLGFKYTYTPGQGGCSK
jgi:hypothetical protein